jgi:hypothetical protein
MIMLSRRGSLTVVWGSSGHHAAFAAALALVLAEARANRRGKSTSEVADEIAARLTSRRLGSGITCGVLLQDWWRQFRACHKD